MIMVHKWDVLHGFEISIFLTLFYAHINHHEDILPLQAQNAVKQSKQKMFFKKLLLLKLQKCKTCNSVIFLFQTTDFHIDSLGNPRTSLTEEAGQLTPQKHTVQ